ncbi:Gustatory Receptor [Nesidiocoris tenuis]|uniref:Gustatory receptor n=1 Tax=Nesidiocoris tenuis TaxID=355587 RepID=A0ABN7B0S8_9HEMI|nr:Gustatory Receptor [Nesidiocoris tenuis]
MTGKLRIKLISWPFLYWLVGYCIIAAVNAENFFELFKHMINEKMSFLELIIAGYNVVIMVYFCTYVGSVFSEFSMLADFLNYWSDVEVTYERGIGKPMSFKHKRRCDFLASIVLPFSFIIVVLMKDVIYYVHWYSLSVHVVALSALITMSEYAVISNQELMNLNRGIKRKIVTDLCSLGSAIPSACDIANLRIAWLHLNVAIKAHFEAWSYVGTNICITLQIVFVTSLFAAISELLSGKNLPLDLIVLVVASCNISFIVFNNGHRLSENAGADIAKALAHVNLLPLETSAREEVKLFMKVVRINYRDLTFGGIVICNRGTITDMVSVTVTYLIILLQLERG